MAAALHWLDLDTVAIEDLSALSDLAGLEILTISEAPALRDIRPLRGLPRLKQLHLSNTSITDITPLAALTALEGLSILRWGDGDGPPLSLRPLAGLRRLVHLTVVPGESLDLDALRSLTALTELSLRVGSDLGPIPQLPRLKDLEVQSASLDSVAPLRSARRLESLVLRVERPIELRPLAEIHTLRGLHVDSTVRPEELEAELEVLRQLRPNLRLYNDPDPRPP